MLPWWYRQHPALKVAAVALAAGLALGGLLVLAIGGPQLSPLGKPQRSIADAIFSDQPQPTSRSSRSTLAKWGSSRSGSRISTRSPR